MASINFVNFFVITLAIGMVQSASVPETPIAEPSAENCEHSSKATIEPQPLKMAPNRTLNAETTTKFPITTTENPKVVNHTKEKQTESMTMALKESNDTVMSKHQNDTVSNTNTTEKPKIMEHTMENKTNIIITSQKSDNKTEHQNDTSTKITAGSEHKQESEIRMGKALNTEKASTEPIKSSNETKTMMHESAKNESEIEHKSNRTINSNVTTNVVEDTLSKTNATNIKNEHLKNNEASTTMPPPNTKSTPSASEFIKVSALLILMPILLISF